MFTSQKAVKDGGDVVSAEDGGEEKEGERCGTSKNKN